MRSRTAFMGVLAVAGVVGLLGQLALLAGALGFSRDHELDADRIGLLLMRRAGYDTREAARVWANLRAELSAGAGGDPAKRSVLFATHPPSDERERILGELAASDSGFVGDTDFARRIEPFMPELIEDELRRAQYDETIVLMVRLSSQRPQRADFHYARGEAHRLRNQQDDPTSAEQALRAASALEQPPPATHRSLGLLYRQQGRKREAKAAFDEYLKQAPVAPDAAMIQSYLSELT
jgi:predicted Zn-dependent protease